MTTATFMSSRFCRSCQCLRTALDLTVPEPHPAARDRTLQEIVTVVSLQNFQNHSEVTGDPIDDFHVVSLSNETASCQVDVNTCMYLDRKIGYPESLDFSILPGYIPARSRSQ